MKDRLSTLKQARPKDAPAIEAADVEAAGLLNAKPAMRRTKRRQ